MTDSSPDAEAAEHPDDVQFEVLADQYYVASMAAVRAELAYRLELMRHHTRRSTGDLHRTAREDWEAAKGERHARWQALDRWLQGRWTRPDVNEVGQSTRHE